MALQFDKLEFNFAKGLNQKSDPRLSQAPELVRAVDVEFDDIGGLRLRYPYASIGSTIFAGGPIGDCRRVYAVGDELILFTKTALLSWSPQRAAWIFRATHLAVKTEEKPVFVSTGDQTDCDRAQLNGTVVYAWTDGSTLVSPTVYVAAADAETGAVLMAPTAIVAARRPRVIACSTRILLLYMSAAASDLYAVSIDPATPSVGAPTTLRATTASFYYDAVRSLGTPASALVALRRNPTTSYEVIRVAEAGTITLAVTKARTCTGAIAICDAPSGEVQVIRANGTNIQGDQLVASTLADTFTAQAIGTTASSAANHIAACFRSVQTSGTYRCYAFWSSDESTGGSDWQSRYNYVTVSNSLGTEGTFVRRLGVASRAFDYDGSVYVHGAFAGASQFVSASALFSPVRSQLQNTYFLYRDDAFLCAKLVTARAGGLPTAGYLPGVALTGTATYSWCGTDRRVIPVGEKGYGYSDNGPRDIAVTFDSNDARRVAKLGETVYITGGELLQYDGTYITEVGFHIYPWYMGAIEAASGGIATNGDYAYKGTLRYDNARGERERSTTATSGAIAITSQPAGVTISAAVPLYVTHKTYRPPSMEWWRSAVNSGAPFYLVTNQDPQTTTGDNCFVANDPSLGVFADFVDAFSDATLTTKEPNPENDAVLENLAPPPATLIAASDTRLFLAGIPGEPHTVIYSKLRNAGEIVAFHDTLTVAIPEAGGDITGLAFLNETLVVFRETAIYAVDGRGFTNTGEGQNYESRLVASDCGAVNQESIALTPSGLVFKSSKGWYLLNRGWATQYIGAPVCDYDSESVYAAHVVEAQHQLRIVTSGRVLVLDYNVEGGAWCEWSISDGLHACMWNGVHHVMATAAVRAQQTSHATTTHGADIEVLVHTNGLQGFARVRKIALLGEYRSAHTQRWRIGTYEEGTYFQDKTITPSGYTVGDELAELVGPSQQQHKVLRIRITTANVVDSLGEQVRLTGMSLDVGLKRGIYPQLGVARRH